MSSSSPGVKNKRKEKTTGRVIHTVRRRKKVKLRGFPIELRVAYVSGACVGS